MTVLVLALTLLWLFAVSYFARWRIDRLRQEGAACPHLVGDWATQLFLKGSGTILLALIVICLVHCR